MGNYLLANGGVGDPISSENYDSISSVYHEVDLEDLTSYKPTKVIPGTTLPDGLGGFVAGGMCADSVCSSTTQS